MVDGHFIAQLSVQPKHVGFVAVFFNGLYTACDCLALTWDFTTQDEDKTPKLIPLNFVCV